MLGSATPSLETLHLAAAGRIRRFQLPERIGARPLPPVEVIDLRSAPRVPEAGGVPWTEPLDGAVRDALSRGDQVILLLNRRGFATFLQCPACGDVRECPHCAISLTVHQTPPALRCHYCGHEAPVPSSCRVCGAETQRMRGLGTQRLEHFVALRFPAARIARMDLDTTSTKWAHHRILERVARGEVDILLGTQMIAKGLDFPNVTVVGVVDADTGLHLPDFRAAERTFQLVAQVAGRAGRGPRGGRVFVQTRAPDHHAIRAAAAHSGAEFVAAELPPKQEQTLEVELHPRHRKLYDTHLQRERQKILRLFDDFDRNRFTILQSITRMRQLSLHPALVDGRHSDLPCAKLDALVDQLDDVTASGHRALVFSQFTGFLSHVRARLDKEGIGYGYVTSRMGTRLTGDPRDVALRDALYSSLPASEEAV